MTGTETDRDMIGVNVPAAILAIGLAVALNIAMIAAAVYLRRRG